MVNKGFPKFGMSQAGSFVAALKNYNLPDFILKLVANDTQSELLERGRIADRLQSMNDTALELLNAIFVECQEDEVDRVFAVTAEAENLYVYLHNNVKARRRKGFRI